MERRGICLKYIFEKTITNSGNSDWWMGVHIIAIVGLCIRLVLVFVSDLFHHPDEVFQNLEQAHRVVFGYGHIPWEYRFGIRSWIVPGFISVWLIICKVLHHNSADIYIPLVKSVTCVLSTSLIYFAYIIGRTIASENAGRLSCIFVCFWYELVYFAHKTTPETLAMISLTGALACAVANVNQRKPILFGLLSALCIVLRFQFMPAIFILVLFVCFTWMKNEFIKAGLIFLLIIAVAGYIDYLTWGSFFASYYNNYLYNKVYKISEIFGTKPFWYFLTKLTWTSAGVFSVIGLLSLTKLHKVWLPLACILSVILSHSIIPHKEYRFVLAVIPVFLILTSVIVSDYISNYIHSSKQTIFYFLTSLSLFFISVMGLLRELPLEKYVYHRPLYTEQEIVKAYKYLSHEPDLVAVLNTYTTWAFSPGYYYLHRNVPIYFEEHINAKSIKSYELTSYVSHIVCPTTSKVTPGFKPIIKIGDLEIRRQINTPYKYLNPDIDAFNLYYGAIEDNYVPTVKKRW